MIPKGGTLNQVTEIKQQPSNTYRLNFSDGRIAGMTDDMDAIKQAIFKILQTERNSHLIYSPDYGIDLSGLIGRDHAFVQSELRRRIQEALLQDDRIMAVEDMQITFEDDRATASFVVVTQYGSFNMSRGVG